MTILYYSRIDAIFDKKIFTKLVNILPKQVSEKANRYKRWQDKQAVLMGKYLLLCGLKEYGCGHFLENIKLSAYGRPFIQNSEIDFNISHSGNYVVCVVSNIAKVGVDIEKMLPVDPNLLRYLFDGLKVDNCSSRDVTNFYHEWTAREAIVKADGRGMSLPLHNIRVQSKKGNADGQVYWLLKMLFDEEHILHVASNMPVGHEIRLKQIPCDFKL